MCDGWCTHTLLSHAQFSLLQSVQVILAQTSMRVHTHAWLKAQRSVKRCFAVHVVSLRIALSTLMFHPPSLLYLEGDFPWSTAFSNFVRPKIAEPAHSHTIGEQFVYIAESAHSTGFEPKQLDKLKTVDSDTTPIDDPHRDNISGFSPESHVKALDCSVFLRRVDLLLSRTILVAMLLCRKKAIHGKPRTDREREEREGSVTNTEGSMSRKSRQNSIRSHSHQSRKEL